MRTRTWSLVALVAVVSLLAFSSPTSAQSQAIGFTDELEACVSMPDGSMWLSTVALRAQLEAATGKTAIVASATTFSNAARPAGGGRYFRCENCQPAAGSQFLATLIAKGYTVETDGLDGALPGASDGWVRFSAP